MSEQASSVPTPSLEVPNTQESPQKSIEDIIISTGCDASILEDYQDELKTINSTPEGKKQFEQAIQRELEKQSPPLPDILIQNIITQINKDTTNGIAQKAGETVAQAGETVAQAGETVAQAGETVAQAGETLAKSEEDYNNMFDGGEIGPEVTSLEKHISTISEKLGKENPIIQEADTQAERIIASGKADTPELQSFLEKNGVTDAGGNVLPEKKDAYARIVRAHVSTRTFIEHRSELEATKDPDIQKAMKNIVAEAPGIGVTLRGKYPDDFSKLITDQPRAEREKIEQAAHVISGGKDIPMTREGNMLHFQNPEKPTESTHSIDLSQKPPLLIKKEGILETKRSLSEKPDTKMAEDREKREQDSKKIEALGSNILSQTEKLTPITEGIPEQDKKKLEDISYDTLKAQSNEISELTKARPIDREKLQTLLENQKNQIGDIRSQYEGYIAEGKEQEFPAGLEEENKRRGLLDTTFHTLDSIQNTNQALQATLESLGTEPKETPKDDAQKANESFEIVSNHNLGVLRDLGFDRWDSMDDVSAFIEYADSKSRSGSGLEYPRNKEGVINLGSRKIGEEGKYLIEGLHTLLGPSQKQENPDAQKNIIEKYRDIRADIALGTRGQILTNYHLLKLDHGGALSSDILGNRTKTESGESTKQAPMASSENPPQ